MQLKNSSFANNKYLRFALVILLFVVILLIPEWTFSFGLSPALNYEEGSSEIPEGQLFLTAIEIKQSCSFSCGCPTLEEPTPGYRVEDGEIWILENRIRNYRMTDSPLGFIGYGEYNFDVYMLDEIPYQTEYKNMTVHTADSNGTLVVTTTNNKTYSIESGQRWTQIKKLYQGKLCWITETTSFVNYGLFPVEKIHFE